MQVTAVLQDNGGRNLLCEFINYEHNPRGQYSIKLARAVLPSYEIRSQLAQNNAHDGGPITGYIMKIILTLA